MALPDQPEEKKIKTSSNNTLSIVLGVLGLFLVIAIIGFGALLAGHVWDPVWNPFRHHVPGVQHIKN
jgi:hypothetical protein